MLTGPIVRRALPLAVAEKIGKAIVSEALKPGSSLPSELELTRELGVSRSVLREALKVLSGKGLVSSRPKSGTVVLPPLKWNTLDVDVLGWRLESRPSVELVNQWFDFRRQFEPFAARLAAQRGDAPALCEIAEAGRRFAGKHHDVAASINADVELHQAILEASGNEFLVPLGLALEGALRASFRLSTHRLGAREGAMPLHQGVVDAILRCDAQEAESSMVRLIEASREDLLWVLARQEQAGSRLRQRVPRTRPGNNGRRPAP